MLLSCTQGHESEIVILSLVRHNYNKTLGITGDRHRMVVATSRQQRALYIVGNAAFFEEASPRCWRVSCGMVPDPFWMSCSVL